MDNNSRMPRFSRRPSKFFGRNMDKLRRSFRDSFRRRGSGGGLRSSGGGSSGSSNRPSEWTLDENAVRAGTCSFNVKYLGCVEVFDSRGMHVCEEALKLLRSQKRNPIRGIFYVSGDGLRVADAQNKGLVVDQTVEKVSFCAPDRHHERGFAYICRDGTTRRWMCHGFHAAKESGERLSHAVGCAFAVCLEKKQKRDREAGVISPPAASAPPPSRSATLPHNSANNSMVKAQDLLASHNDVGDNPTSPFRRGDFRRLTLPERIRDPQEAKLAAAPPVRPTQNPHAIARPSANHELAGSLRVFQNSNTTSGTGTPNGGIPSLNQQPQQSLVSPFKRSQSLRPNELDANRLRAQAGVTSPKGGPAGGVPYSAHRVVGWDGIMHQRPSISMVPDVSPLPEEDFNALTNTFSEIGVTSQQQQQQSNGGGTHHSLSHAYPPHNLTGSNSFANGPVPATSPNNTNSSLTCSPYHSEPGMHSSPMIALGDNFRNLSAMSFNSATVHNAAAVQGINGPGGSVMSSTLTVNSVSGNGISDATNQAINGGGHSNFNRFEMTRSSLQQGVKSSSRAAEWLETTSRQLQASKPSLPPAFPPPGTLNPVDPHSSDRPPIPPQSAGSFQGNNPSSQPGNLPQSASAHSMMSTASSSSNHFPGANNNHSGSDIKSANPPDSTAALPSPGRTQVPQAYTSLSTAPKDPFLEQPGATSVFSQQNSRPTAVNAGPSDNYNNNVADNNASNVISYSRLSPTHSELSSINGAPPRLSPQSHGYQQLNNSGQSQDRAESDYVNICNIANNNLASGGTLSSSSSTQGPFVSGEVDIFGQPVFSAPSPRNITGPNSYHGAPNPQLPPATADPFEARWDSLASGGGAPSYQTSAAGNPFSV